MSSSALKKLYLPPMFCVEKQHQKHLLAMIATSRLLLLKYKNTQPHVSTVDKRTVVLRGFLKGKDVFSGVKNNIINSNSLS